MSDEFTPLASVSIRVLDDALEASTEILCDPQETTKAAHNMAVEICKQKDATIKEQAKRIADLEGQVNNVTHHLVHAMLFHQQENYGAAYQDLVEAVKVISPDEPVLNQKGGAS